MFKRRERLRDFQVLGRIKIQTQDSSDFKPELTPHPSLRSPSGKSTERIKWSFASLKS